MSSYELQGDFNATRTADWHQATLLLLLRRRVELSVRVVVLVERLQLRMRVLLLVLPVEPFEPVEPAGIGVGEGLGKGRLARSVRNDSQDF